MTARLEAICAGDAPCKCCLSRAVLYGVVDFHKNCMGEHAKVLGVSGVPIYYYRCPECQFVFTTAFDHFTKDDFLHYIYNDEYVRVDPDYLDKRPRASAQSVINVFATARPRRILDFGGGNGVLAEVLRAAGFADVETYDPFVPRFASRPPGRFDCIVCFEVVEHTTEPRRVFAEMNELLMDSGIILFSTLVQPADFDREGLNWWYAAPRNGHVSLYTRASLAKVVEPLGFRLGSFDPGSHVLFREVPEFARHFIQPLPVAGPHTAGAT